jgi:hypothetical protein
MNSSPLVQTLQGSSLHTLLVVTAKALSRSGFGDVQILDRRQTKQKSRFGGHELICQTDVGMVPLKIIVKVINDAGRLRMMDELAGAVIRNGADFGLLITPHHLTKNASKHKGSYHRARLEVLHGEAFADLLRKHRIGVRSKGEVDYAFFAELEVLSTRLLTFLKEEL